MGAMVCRGKVAVVKTMGASMEAGVYGDELDAVLNMINCGSLGGGIRYGCAEHIAALLRVEQQLIETRGCINEGDDTLLNGGTLPVKTEAQPGSVEFGWGFGGGWIDASKELPDADTTVLVCIKDASEPVWLGHHNGELWCDVEGFVIEVSYWAEIPLAPGENVEGA